MTKKEAAIISLYTGIMCGEFSDMHKYAEEIMQRPILTHEFGNDEYYEKLKQKCKPDFLKICKNLTD